MAGTCKPSASNIGDECAYKVLSVQGSQGSGGTVDNCGLFDEQAVNEWNTDKVFYWYNISNFVEIEVYKPFNIWRTGTNSYNGYNSKLYVYKFNESTNEYEDITNTIVQNLSAIGNTVWEEWIHGLPKGRYKFTGGQGLRIDSEWYLEESVISSEEAIVSITNFPVKIGDYTIQTEADILSYAKTLTNGEKQLLVSEVLKKMYLTNGTGGMVELSTGESGNGGSSVSIDDANISTTKVFSNAKTTELVNGCLDKDTFVSTKNEGAVKYADNLSTIVKTNPLQYYGTNHDNKLGMHYFPINIDKTNTGIEQKVILNVKANTEIMIDSALNISDNKVIVDSYKFVEGQQDIKTDKLFNNSESTNFFYDKDKIEFTDNMHIKKEYKFDFTLDTDSLYKSEIINKNDFIDFIEMGVE